MALGPPFDLEFCDLRLQDGTLKKMALPETWGTTSSSSPSTVVARGQGIFLVPSFVQNDECDKLMSAAAERCDSNHPEEVKIRLPVEKLPKVHELCDHLIRRTLTLMEEQLPILADSLFGQAVDLCDMDVSFSLNEPAVNVYGAGAGFEQHEDGHMLTILVPLAEPVAFEGGGTAFWPNVLMAGGTSFTTEPPTNNNEPRPPKSRDRPISDGQVMLPPRGTAMLFVGSVTHSGVTVTSGESMVWVASFTLRPFKTGLTPMTGRLLVGNKVSKAKAALAMQRGSEDAAFADEDVEREVYNGLRGDLRAELAAAAAAAASELDGRRHHVDKFEGLMDAMLAYRQQMRLAQAAPCDQLRGSPLISVLQSVDEM